MCTKQPPPASIASLCRRELKAGTGLRFNPREFINYVLRDTLVLRPLHEAQAFPPPDFKGAAPVASVALALGTRAMPTEQRERLGPALVYWANNPTDLISPPTVGEGIFKAFHLPWPFAPGARVVSPPAPATRPGASPARQPEPPKPEKQAPAFNVGDVYGAQRIALADRGISFLERALAIRPTYREAMTYMNLLYRQKSFAYFDKPEEWQKAIDSAEMWRKKAMEGHTPPAAPAPAPPASAAP